MVLSGYFTRDDIPTTLYFRCLYRARLLTTTVLYIDVSTSAQVWIHRHAMLHGLCLYLYLVHTLRETYGKRTDVF